MWNTLIVQPISWLLRTLYDLEIINGVEFIKVAYRLGKGEEDES